MGKINVVTELTPEQQQKAIVLDEKISNVMKGAALKYMDLLLNEADRLPANEFLELSDGIIRSASLEAAKLLIEAVREKH